MFLLIKHYCYQTRKGQRMCNDVIALCFAALFWMMSSPCVAILPRTVVCTVRNLEGTTMLMFPAFYYAAAHVQPFSGRLILEAFLIPSESPAACLPSPDPYPLAGLAVLTIINQTNRHSCMPSQMAAQASASGAAVILVAPDIATITIMRPSSRYASDGDLSSKIPYLSLSGTTAKQLSYLFHSNDSVRLYSHPQLTNTSSSLPLSNVFGKGLFLTVHRKEISSNLGWTSVAIGRAYMISGTVLLVAAIIISIARYVLIRKWDDCHDTGNFLYHSRNFESSKPLTISRLATMQLRPEMREVYQAMMEIFHGISLYQTEMYLTSKGVLIPIPAFDSQDKSNLKAHQKQYKCQQSDTLHTKAEKEKPGRDSSKRNTVGFYRNNFQSAEKQRNSTLHSNFCEYLQSSIINQDHLTPSSTSTISATKSQHHRVYNGDSDMWSNENMSVSNVSSILKNSLLSSKRKSSKYTKQMRQSRKERLFIREGKRRAIAAARLSNNIFFPTSDIDEEDDNIKTEHVDGSNHPTNVHYDSDPANALLSMQRSWMNRLEVLNVTDKHHSSDSSGSEEAMCISASPVRCTMKRCQKRAKAEAKGVETSTLSVSNNGGSKSGLLSKQHSFAAIALDALSFSDSSSTTRSSLYTTSNTNRSDGSNDLNMQGNATISKDISRAIVHRSLAETRGILDTKSSNPDFLNSEQRKSSLWSHIPGYFGPSPGRQKLQNRSKKSSQEPFEGDRESFAHSSTTGRENTRRSSCRDTSGRNHGQRHESIVHRHYFRHEMLPKTPKTPHVPTVMLYEPRTASQRLEQHCTFPPELSQSHCVICQDLLAPCVCIGKTKGGNGSVNGNDNGNNNSNSSFLQNGRNDRTVVIHPNQQTYAKENVNEQQLQRSGDTAVMRLPCHHVFHRQCIWLWFHYHYTCPICKYNLIYGGWLKAASMNDNEQQALIVQMARVFLHAPSSERQAFVASMMQLSVKQSSRQHCRYSQPDDYTFQSVGGNDQLNSKPHEQFARKMDFDETQLHHQDHKKQKRQPLLPSLHLSPILASPQPMLPLPSSSGAKPSLSRDCYRSKHRNGIKRNSLPLQHIDMLPSQNLPNQEHNLSTGQLIEKQTPSTQSHLLPRNGSDTSNISPGSNNAQRNIMLSPVGIHCSSFQSNSKTETDNISLTKARTLTSRRRLDRSMHPLAICSGPRDTFQESRNPPSRS